MSDLAGAARRSRSRDEDAIQTSVINFLRLVLPRHKVFHISNGAGKLSVRAGRLLKAKGVLAGVPDIEIVAPGGLAFFMEVKADEGRPSQAQRDFQAWCSVNHVPHAYVRSVDDAQRALVGWDLIKGVAA